MERGIDGRAVDRLEIGLRMVGRTVMNEPERASRSAHRDRLHPAIGAGGDVAERPGRVEQAALARIAIGEADAPVGRVVGDALAVRIDAGGDRARADAIGLFRRSWPWSTR